MATIYLSSTYEDLKDWRRPAVAQLRVMHHTVIGMEDYAAADERPLDKCLADVATCDIYIGIFAWRYGFVPPKDNPAGLSITELEYHKAGERGIPRLIFLVDDATPWTPKAMDSVCGEGDGGARVERLKTELRTEHSCKYFSSPEDLTMSVMAAVHLQTQLRDSLNAAVVNAVQAFPDELAAVDALRFGTTMLPDLEKQIVSAVMEAGSARLAQINLGNGRAWWSTRLHLVAALASDFTSIERLVFLTDGRRFAGFADPRQVRRMLSSMHPEVEAAYRASLPGPSSIPIAPDEQVRQTIFQYSLNMQSEAVLKQWFDQGMLAGRLGPILEMASIEYSVITPLVLYDIMKESCPMVAHVQAGQLAHVIDRTGLSARIMRDLLRQRLDALH
jgi:hypothetical protein